MRAGFRGMENSLTTGAEQVERLAGYTYPVFRMNGLRPEVSHRQFWPEGEEIAEGMRKAAAGVSAGNKELEDMAADLPKFRASLAESSKMVEKLQEALGLALEQQDKVEPLLKDVPAHAARLVEELPKLGGDLSRILRDTGRLKEVAAALRQAQKGIEAAVARWPELRLTLTRLAALLTATRDQLSQALLHRQEYEKAMQQTINLADDFASLLPLLSDQLDCRLDEEDQALEEMGQALGEVSEALPAYAQTTATLLHTGHLLAWLVAAIIGLHGCYLIAGSRLGRRYSP
jgi:chromosome segregation ATPase